MSRTSDRMRVRRARRTRAALLAAATLVVAVLVACGTLVATGVWGLGGGSPAAGPSASVPVIPSPSFTPPPSEGPAPSATPPATPAPATPTEPPPPPAFDRAALSIDDPTSPWVVVNKLRPLQNGADYVPPDLVELPADIPNPNGYPLRAEAATALEQMFQAAKAETGIQLIAQSGYRSYAKQVDAYGYYVNLLGTEGADLTSARPGYSEHQTGMAMDILGDDSDCGLDGRCFADTAAGQWLAANSYRFGYVLRYPDGGTPITGYEFEPWHYRYIGVPAATEMHATGTGTLEEFFGLPPAPGYAP